MSFVWFGRGKAAANFRNCTPGSVFILKPKPYVRHCSYFGSVAGRLAIRSYLSMIGPSTSHAIKTYTAAAILLAHDRDDEGMLKQ